MHSLYLYGQRQQEGVYGVYTETSVNLQDSQMPAMRVQSVLAVAIYTLFTSTIDYLRTSCVSVSTYRSANGACMPRVIAVSIVHSTTAIHFGSSSVATSAACVAD